MNTSAIGLFAKLNPTRHMNGIRHHENRVSDGGNESSRISPANRGRPNDGRAFVHDVMESLNSLGLNLQGVQGDSASSGGSAEEVREALHTFLHDLHQVLNQNGGIQAAPTTEGGDTATESSSSQSSAIQNGYSNVKTNLQDLITSLSEGTGDSGTLQADFNNLVTALGGSTSETGLVDFLKQLDSTASNSAVPSNTSGSILTAQA